MSQDSKGEALTLKSNALGFKDVLVFGLLFMVPIAPISVFGEVAKASGNKVPLVYLIACIAMIFTGLSYYHFAKKYPMSGSVYTYITKGINPYIGFIAGWIILLDYFFIPALLYKTMGIYVNDMFGAPWWVWAVATIALVTIVNLLGITDLSRVNWVCLVLECICLVIVIALAIKFVGNGGGFGKAVIDPLYEKGALTPQFIATACSIACLSFLGFDGISTLAEETRNPEKTVGKAIIAAIIVAGFIFVFQTYIYELAWGGKDPSVFPDAMGFYVVFDQFASGWVYSIVQGIFIVAIFVNVLVGQAGAARIVFNMARDRNLPGFLSKISPKRQAPYTATLAIAIISLGVMFIPYETLVLLVNIGAISSFILLDIAVIWHFVGINKEYKSVKDWILYIICPIIGAAILVFVLTGFSWVTYVVLGGWVVIGLIILGIRTQGFKNPPGQIEGI
ncbi:MAG: APC family permease [Firmicutes bacterium]|nr:APC family permease [Bacillota bacterium]